MRFVVEGIGKIGRAEILLDGITLIVGENQKNESHIPQRAVPYIVLPRHYGVPGYHRIRP